MQVGYTVVVFGATVEPLKVELELWRRSVEPGMSKLF